MLLLINVCSCKPKPETSKEIIYKNYSFKQLKKYLEGKWIEIGDTSQEEFTFTYKPKSDTSGYIKPLKRLEYHVTFFDIRKSKADYLIQFTPFMPSPDRKFWKIKKISNIEFVLEKDKYIIAYKKIHGN